MEAKKKYSLNFLLSSCTLLTTLHYPSFILYFPIIKLIRREIQNERIRKQKPRELITNVVDSVKVRTLCRICKIVRKAYYACMIIILEKHKIQEF